jgi:small subunit ribosomal protein S3
VGQKTNPTTFRLGVVKKNRATWFTTYGRFRDVLREDYNVRKLFEKKFNHLYNSAGIVRVEIERTLNGFLFIIHATRPKTLTLFKKQKNLIKELKKDFSRFVSVSKKSV